MLVDRFSRSTAHPRSDRDDVAGQVLALGGARLGAAGLSACTALVLAHQLSKEDYGRLSLLTGIVGLVVVLSDVGLTSSLARFVSERRARRGLLIRVMAARAAVAGVAAAGVLAYAAGGGLGHVGSAAMVATALLMANSTVSLAQGLLPALRRVRTAALLTVVVPAVELTGILIASQIGLTAPTALIAMAVAASTGAALSLVVLLTQALPTVDSASMPDVLRYALPLFGVLLCDSVFGVVDQIVIAAFHGAAAVAPYALSWKLAMFLHLPAVAVAVVVGPRLARDRAQAGTLFRLWFQRTVILQIGLVVVVAALAPDVLGLINEHYRSDGLLLRLLTGYAVLLGMAPMLSIALNYLGGAQGRLRIAAMAVALNVVLDLVLVPGFGAAGAAVSSTVAYLLYVGGHARLLSRSVDGVWRGGSALAATTILGAASAIAVAVITSHALPSTTPLSPVLAAALALAVYLGIVARRAFR